jgi:hypothetical protein
MTDIINREGQQATVEMIFELLSQLAEESGRVREEG